ncbi:MAG: hypothetical protein HKN16_02860, partial [Saprospiraceae bacterium]|nr:hypothetical protein [Saprospiraceae bacterium]
MNSSTKLMTRITMMIALAIGLSSHPFAQTTPANDDCDAAIRLAATTDASYYDFSLEGANKSNGLTSTPCKDLENTKDVWFSLIMPENGNLELSMQAEKACPSLTAYTGS